MDDFEIVDNDMDFICALCLRRFSFDEHGVVSSTITLNANYGARHDMTHIMLRVCPNCIDAIMDRFGVNENS